MKKYRKEKSFLFLMELLASIFLFSITSAICIRFFVQAHLASETSYQLTKSVSFCENAAELFKSGDGSLTPLTEAYPNSDLIGNSLLIYFDESYEPCEKNKAHYFLEIAVASENSNSYADIFFREDDASSTIYKLHTAKHFSHPPRKNPTEAVPPVSEPYTQGGDLP